MLITSYLSTKAPVFIAPAMDLDMYAHPSTQCNIETLRSRGNYIIEPQKGELASHLVGKGRMLGAIALLMGQRADTKSIRQGEKRCTVEAHFDLSNYDLQSFFEENELDYEEDCIVRREISASGKTRAFINDTPVQLAQLKALGEQLIDIHSQHQNLLLNSEGFQLNVLDILAYNQNQLDVYQILYNEWKKAEKELKDLKESVEKNRIDEDYIRFQLEELEKANLVDGEEEDMQQEFDILTHVPTLRKPKN